MSQPRRSKCTTSLFYWDDGVTLFTGNLVLGLIPPVYDDGSTTSDWPTMALGNSTIFQELPRFTRIPIVNGLASQTETVFYNEDIDPPGSKYLAWFYDRNLLKLTFPTISSAFTVSTPTFTPTIVAPELPVTSTTVPVPD